MLTHLLADSSATFWLPEQASNFAPEHDWAFYFIYWLSVVAFVVGGAVSIGFAIRFRRKSPDQRTSPIRDHLRSEERRVGKERSSWRWLGSATGKDKRQTETGEWT